MPEQTFGRYAMLRVARARRLTHDLELNTAGVALALELLEEIDQLRSRLRAHEQ